MMGDKVREMSETCEGKQIDLIASGYNKSVLPYAWLSLICGIADFPITVEEPEPIPIQYQNEIALESTIGVIEEVKKFHKDYWKCFR
jgi:acetoin utilization deacetylase AcuC-like enzyme